MLFDTLSLLMLLRLSPYYFFRCQRLMLPCQRPFHCDAASLIADAWLPRR